MKIGADSWFLFLSDFDIANKQRVIKLCHPSELA